MGGGGSRSGRERRLFSDGRLETPDDARPSPRRRPPRGGGRRQRLFNRHRKFRPSRRHRGLLRRTRALAPRRRCARGESRAQRSPPWPPGRNRESGFRRLGSAQDDGTPGAQHRGDLPRATPGLRGICSRGELSLRRLPRRGSVVSARPPDHGVYEEAHGRHGLLHACDPRYGSARRSMRSWSGRFGSETS